MKSNVPEGWKLERKKFLVGYKAINKKWPFKQKSKSHTTTKHQNPPNNNKHTAQATFHCLSLWPSGPRGEDLHTSQAAVIGLPSMLRVADILDTAGGLLMRYCWVAGRQWRKPSTIALRVLARSRAFALMSIWMAKTEWCITTEKQNGASRWKNRMVRHDGKTEWCVTSK